MRRITPGSTFSVAKRGYRRTLVSEERRAFPQGMKAPKPGIAWRMTVRRAYQLFAIRIARGMIQEALAERSGTDVEEVRAMEGWIPARFSRPLLGLGEARRLHRRGSCPRVRRWARPRSPRR
jgi:hypothetical protein